MERVILDVDTGLDDAVALFLAAGLEEIQVEAVIATNGNVALSKTVENTLNIMETAGCSCPVYKGSDKPLVRKHVIAGEFHGESGLDGPVFGKRKLQHLQEGDGITEMIRLLYENPKEISIVSVGPLTDLAIALEREPNLPTLVKQIIIMGGSFSEGNVTKEAEFNTFADPEAARIVFSCKAKLVLFPLDCTRQVTLSPERLSLYHAKPGRSTEVFAACMDTYMANYEKHAIGWPQIHDPLCVAYLVDPSKVKTILRKVNVDITGGPSYGKTTQLPAGEDDGVWIATTLDIPWFWSLIDRALAALP
ncbi:MAG: nucleoside hydrolase [Sphaerochaeta sp.]|uniref:nucleoside hydrolase n=1 Tax=Sphaerochaeta sp. TaxID=1972642 RepID=UPI003D0E2CA4